MTYSRMAAWRHAWPSSIRRTSAPLLVALALTAAAGCGGADSGTGPSAQGPYGEYDLVAVDGAALPVQVHNGPYLDRTRVHFYNRLNLHVTGGEVHLHDDGTFYIAVEASGDGDGEPVDGSSEFEASFKLIDGELTVITQGQAVPIGTVEDGTVTIGLDLMGKGVKNQFTFAR